MDIPTMIVIMGVLAGAWGVTAWFIYRRMRSLTTQGHDTSTEE